MPDQKHSDNEIGAFLEGIPLGQAYRDQKFYTPDPVEKLIANGKRGQLNALEVEDMIKRFGFVPAQFEEVAGGRYRLKDLPNGK